MKIIIRDGFIDLADPVYMDHEKRERFLDEMRDIFGDIETVDTIEIVPPGPGGGDQQKWKSKDLVELFQGKSIAELEVGLDRTSMSIGMKLVKFVPAVTKWMKKNGITTYPPTEEIIDQYLHERGLQ
jgi:hypothetical protein